jgi:predicted ribonuclease YlaK
MTLDLAALDRIEAEDVATRLSVAVKELDNCYNTDRVAHANAREVERQLDELAEIAAALSPEVVGELVRWARKGMEHEAIAAESQEWASRFRAAISQNNEIQSCAGCLGRCLEPLRDGLCAECWRKYPALREPEAQR